MPKIIEIGHSLLENVVTCFFGKRCRYSRHLWHSARKRDGLILQRSWAHMGQTTLSTLEVYNKRLRYTMEIGMSKPPVV